jgi:hypothetical protein
LKQALAMRTIGALDVRSDPAVQSFEPVIMLAEDHVGQLVA